MKKIGIGVLAVAFMSNCFLTGYLNEGLKPYNTVTGAQAKQIINAAAGSAWTTALQMYGTSRSSMTFARLTGGYKFSGAADIGDVYEQRALGGAIAAASKTIVDDEYYTVASLNDCVDNIRNTMIGFGQGRLEEADKAAENCLVETESEIMKAGTWVNATTNTGGGDLNKALVSDCTSAATGTITNTNSLLCGTCVATVLGGSFSTTTQTLANNLASIGYANKAMNTTFNATATTNIALRDGCMDLYMAAFAGKAASKACTGKFGEERIHEALSTTAFMGAQQCKLKKAGSVIQTDFFSL